ncbi:flagellar filament capping protein FliD [Duganella sp. FT3S]|uniref:Flagellar hook-associated protein 2 n=1 Tax=Rugamonas fusca TaxID=2758568 RepID=A0A7W2EGV7_9BURK|nr:flagellar filament capping protein FliD [Rugamonas fusca]MBA5605547.1 flagellar filament capping protein FliD [Rugamonas fusca]
MGISSPGIGSGLDINGIVSKLMQVESAPLADFDKKSASYLAQVSAFGNLSSALGAFQGALSPLTSLSSFQSLTATPSDSSVLSASATTKALPGNYRVNVTQVAQAQTLASGGYKSTTSTIGLGGTTTINFSLGSVSGGSFGLNGTTLGAGVLTGGLTPGALTINGTAIGTDGSTRSARLLADAINAKSGTTGVSAKAAATVTSATLFGAAGASTFGAVDTSGGGTYALTVGGVQVASQAAGVAAGAAGSINAAALDTALTGDTAVTRALADANITVSGSAAAGTLQFTNADGANINVSEAVSGAVTGGIGNSGTANSGSSTTAISAISLVSADASPITVGGTNPAAAGLTAGVGGAYQGATFAADPDRTSGNIVIDSKNNTLQGIADAINKGNFGVTASLVSDGATGTNATPNHLVLTSSATGASSTMRITLSGSGGNPPDADLVNLLGYDPGGTQNLSQKASALDTLANVNGIAVSSSSTSISGAIAGVTVNVNKTGSSTLAVARDTSTLTTSVNGFVKAYNDLNNQISQLSGYNADTKTGGPLLGDSTVRSLQSALRAQMSQQLTGLKGNLTNLSQVGIAFQKDGSLTLDSSKLNKAITSNFNDIAGLFAAVGKTTDSDINFVSSGASTQAGDYAVDITTLATQGSLTSAAALPATTVIDSDTTWTVKLNDTATASSTATITLPAGSYTPSQLATELQSSINGVSSFANAGWSISATVGADGTLKLQSNRYGAQSNISLNDDTGTSVASVFGAATPVAGVDVAGTIGGYSATGDGQTLTGADGAPVAGLKLTVAGTAIGSRGSIGFSQGYAYQLNTLAGNYLGAKGYINGRTTGLNQSVKDIGKQKDALSARLVDVEARYRAQYTKLDTLVASLNSTASYLTQQLASIAKNG